LLGRWVAALLPREPARELTEELLQVLAGQARRGDVEVHGGHPAPQVAAQDTRDQDVPRREDGPDRDPLGDVDVRHRRHVADDERLGRDGL